jgi:hypothetical protein
MRSSLLRKPNLNYQPNISESHPTPQLMGARAVDYFRNLTKRKKLILKNINKLLSPSMQLVEHIELRLRNVTT